MRFNKLFLVGFCILVSASKPFASMNPNPPPDPRALPSRASIVTKSGFKIYALRTGYVGVKQTHRELDVPAWLALPFIFLENTWADWMPVISYVVVHPEGTFVVDTGVPKNINENDFYDCDRNNKFFYQRNMSFFIPKGDALEDQLQAIQIDPQSVAKVVITHFHADHTGGVGLFKNASFITGPGNWPKHVGALTCRLPKAFKPEVTNYNSGPLDEFSESQSLTTDGSVRLVPLTGHTPGHLGLLVKDGAVSYLMAGDATFDLDQTQRGAICGVSQNVHDARQTQSLIQNQILKHTTVLLPAHDPAVLSRLLK
jgi:glyoxylase-like metal-dependent hydrolase (beta-lactamase superfamily II)